MQNSQIYRPHWLAQLLSKSASSIELSSHGLTVHYADKTESILWDDITSIPVFKTGLFFSTVEIASAKGATRASWLPQRIAVLLRDDITRRTYNHHYPRIIRTLESITSSIDKIGYLRTSQLRNISEFAAKHRRNLEAPPMDIGCSDELREAFEKLKAWELSSSTVVEAARVMYVSSQLEKYAFLFDTIESNPLTDRQRRGCVIDEDNNLILAGAGTGKTSTIIGRTAYLIESKKCTENEILLIAYGNQAAKEMRERLTEKLKTDSIKATTFHALGQSIISSVEGGKPSISPLATDDKQLSYEVDRWFNSLLQDDKYRSLALQYFQKYLHPEPNAFEFNSQGEYFEYLNENDIRTFNGEKVKSFEECLIANWMFSMGVDYVYEETYREANTRTPDYRAYKPDFYLPDYGVYIEHFGIDREGNTAPYIDKLSYQQGMRWKRELHQQYNTVLVETFHYEQREGCLLENLKRKLDEVGVTFNPLSDDRLLDQLKDFGAITKFSKLLVNLLQRFKASQMSELELLSSVNDPQLRISLEAAFKLLSPIVEKYESWLNESSEIDFEDMIGLATSYVESGRFKSTWKYILVDEFQDISQPRARLVKALRDSRPGSSTFCVGDDWQSIYRFTGSDVALTMNFVDHFGPTKTTTLDKTFRFNNKISDVASRFIMQNPSQVKKEIVTHSKVDEPSVSLLRRRLVKDNINEALSETLRAIQARAEPGSHVFLLARYNYLLPDGVVWRELKRQHSNLELNKLTFHGSKGKEADYVVILGLDNGKEGFPSRKVTHPLLEALLPKVEPLPHAEERRLFYVALTRAKHRAYLLTDMTKPSCFVKELLEDGYDIDLNEFEVSTDQLTASDRSCPDCSTGVLVKRESINGPFLGCSNYPRCNHTEACCPQCRSEMKKEGRFRICVVEHCSYKIPICPLCLGNMKLRRGPYGAFWGCSNYRSEGPSCSHKEKFIPLQ